MDGTGRAVVSWRRDDGDSGGGGAASLASEGERWERAGVPSGRLSGPPAVGAAPTAGAAAVWSAAGAGDGVRAVQSTR